MVRKSVPARMAVRSRPMSNSVHIDLICGPQLEERLPGELGAWPAVKSGALVAP
jgi:hypothetical protein